MREFKDSDIEGDKATPGTPHKLASPLKSKVNNAQKSSTKKRNQFSSGKKYESDNDKDSSGRKSGTYSSDGGYFDADADSLSDDDNFDDVTA